MSSDGEMVSEFNKIFIDVQNAAKSIETGTRKSTQTIRKSSRKIQSEYSEDSEE